MTSTGRTRNAYDVYRMAADALLLTEGLRTTGGNGSHVTVEDSVGAQFSERVPQFSKPLFEQFRQGRHAAQYFDPSDAEKTMSDAHWAIDTDVGALAGVRELLESGELGPY